MRIPCTAVVALLASACGPEPVGSGGMIDASNGSSMRNDGAVDAAEIPPDAPMVTCPPGLPMSFGNMGTITTTKNGPGSPAMYDAYNVFANLQGNQRWFFAMNLDEAVTAAGSTYTLMGQDIDVAHCRHCVNLFADLDATPGGPSLHMFAQSGSIHITTLSADKTKASGTLTDIMFQAIKVEYDSQSTACSDDINDPICDNSICINNECGRQQILLGCDTSIKSATF
jgi:hypothetical protein